MKKLACFNPSHYHTYTAAMRDGAVDESLNLIEATATDEGLLDLMEIERLVNERLGADVICFGVVHEEVFITLEQYRVLTVDDSLAVKNHIQEVRDAFQYGMFLGSNKPVNTIAVTDLTHIDEEEESDCINTPVGDWDKLEPLIIDKLNGKVEADTLKAMGVQESFEDISTPTSGLETAKAQMARHLIRTIRQGLAVSEQEAIEADGLGIDLPELIRKHRGRPVRVNS